MYDIPWPQKGSRLFNQNGGMNNACLHFTHDKWSLYANGFKDAVTLLSKHVCEHQTNQDTLVYPIVHLFRHYLEVRMKEIIRIGLDLKDHSKNQYPKTHDLNLLFGEVSKVIDLIWPDDDRTPVNSVKECIKEFSKIDPDAMAFRYPEDRKNNINLESLTYINLENLDQVMAEISSFLESVSAGLAHIQDYHNDLRHEYYRMME